MDIGLIESRIMDYSPASKLEELNAFKEISQELALQALSRANFFDQASFLGGTALRILHRLPRFSEDLDFSLNTANPSFDWGPFLKEIEIEFSSYGLQLETRDRSSAKSAIRTAILKEDSFVQVFKLVHERNRADPQVVQIKLEIDTNPPANPNRTGQVVSWPMPFSVTAHDLPTLFAGKINALLTRSFIKGRDWFDLGWYAQKNISINLDYLRSALSQFKFPLPTDPITVDWVKQQLLAKAASIDWKQASRDVEQLLKERDLTTLRLWNKQFFENIINNI